MNARKKPEKHSYLDLFLILLVALVVVGGGVRTYGLHAFARESEQAPFFVELESMGVDALAADCLMVGEELYLTDGGLLGSVASIEAFPLSESVFENGKAYTGEWDVGLRCRIRVRVECMGSEREGVFLRSGKTPVGIGETLTLIGKKSELALRVVSVSPKAG